MVAGRTSKAFRATIGKLTDEQISLIHRWALRTCALCSVLRGSRGSIVLVGLKDTCRSAASFARTIRTAMRGLAIPTSKTLVGHWCHIITQAEAECILLRASSEANVDPRPASGDTTGGHAKSALPESAARARAGRRIRCASFPSSRVKRHKGLPAAQSKLLWLARRSQQATTEAQPSPRGPRLRRAAARNIAVVLPRSCMPRLLLRTPHA